MEGRKIDHLNLFGEGCYLSVRQERRGVLDKDIQKV